MRINLAVVFLCTGLTVLGWSYASADNDGAAEWVLVARDPNYDVAVDSSRIEARMEAAYGRWYPAYEVWYRTDHHAPRQYRGKPFDREVVRSIVQCDSLWYKVMQVDMSMGDRAIARQRTPPNELYDEPWRRVERGTTEEIAAQAACFYGARRAGALVNAPSPR